MAEELSKWQQYKLNLGETRPWDLLRTDTEFTTKELAKDRLDICKACPRLIGGTLQCRECGCFMGAKVHLQKAVCPQGRW